MYSYRMLASICNIFFWIFCIWKFILSILDHIKLFMGCGGIWKIVFEFTNKDNWNFSSFFFSFVSWSICLGFISRFLGGSIEFFGGWGGIKDIFWFSFKHTKEFCFEIFVFVYKWSLKWLNEIHYLKNRKQNCFDFLGNKFGQKHDDSFFWFSIWRL